MRRRLSTGLALVTAGLALTACREVETKTATGYEPAKLEDVKGDEDVKRVTLTAEGARRIGLQTAPLATHGPYRVVPYPALIYDSEGKAYVYVSPEALSFVRAEVEVDRIDGDRVLITKGPPAGTRVATVGAAQVHGAELEIAGSH